MSKGNLAFLGFGLTLWGLALPGFLHSHLRTDTVQHLQWLLYALGGVIGIPASFARTKPEKPHKGYELNDPELKLDEYPGTDLFRSLDAEPQRNAIACCAGLPGFIFAESRTHLLATPADFAALLLLTVMLLGFFYVKTWRWTPSLAFGKLIATVIMVASAFVVFPMIPSDGIWTLIVLAIYVIIPVVAFNFVDENWS